MIVLSLSLHRKIYHCSPLCCTRYKAPCSGWDGWSVSDFFCMGICMCCARGFVSVRRYYATDAEGSNAFSRLINRFARVNEHVMVKSCKCIQNHKLSLSMFSYLFNFSMFSFVSKRWVVFQDTRHMRVVNLNQTSFDHNKTPLWECRLLNTRAFVVDMRIPFDIKWCQINIIGSARSVRSQFLLSILFMNVLK